MAGMLACLALAAGLGASDLEPVPDEYMITLGAALEEKVGKVKDLPFQFNGEWDHAKGVARADRQMGAVIVPSKELKDDRDNAQLSQDKGVPVGLLVLYHLHPEGDIQPSDLYDLELQTEEGETAKVHFVLLTIKKVSDEDFRLQVWGKKKEPLVEDEMDSEEEFGEDKVVIDYSNGELELIWLGRYPSSLFLKEIEPKKSEASKKDSKS